MCNFSAAVCWRLQNKLFFFACAAVTFLMLADAWLERERAPYQHVGVRAAHHRVDADSGGKGSRIVVTKHLHDRVEDQFKRGALLTVLPHNCPAS
jgi:hypothetical protein